MDYQKYMNDLVSSSTVMIHEVSKPALVFKFTKFLSELKKISEDDYTLYELNITTILTSLVEFHKSFNDTVDVILSGIWEEIDSSDSDIPSDPSETSSSDDDRDYSPEERKKLEEEYEEKHKQMLKVKYEQWKKTAMNNTCMTKFNDLVLELIGSFTVNSKYSVCIPDLVKGFRESILKFKIDPHMESYKKVYHKLIFSKYFPIFWASLYTICIPNLEMQPKELINVTNDSDSD